MTIEITRNGELFSAKVTPPHGGGYSWESSEPMVLSKLINELLSRGCHQTDIGDVLYEIDPKLIGIDRRFSKEEAAEVMRRATQLARRNLNSN